MTISASDRDLPNAGLFKIKVRGTRSLCAATVGRPGREVGINIVCLIAARNVVTTNPLYHLQAIRSDARDATSGLLLGEAEYRQIEKYAAELLATGVSEYPFDAVLAAPTSRRWLQEPVLNAIQFLKPGVPDLTTDLQLADRDVNSRSSHSMEERIANLKWATGRDWSIFKNILIVDDVVSQGRTAVPLIHSIRDQCLPAHEPAFTLCAPLWIIRTDAESWITPAEV